MVAGLRLALSSPRTITSDMISPPLSPDFNFDSDVLTSSTLPALEYISEKLQQKTLHVTLLLGRGRPTPTGQPADLIVIPVTKLDPQSYKIFYKIVEKGAKKFSLGQGWTDALDQYSRQQAQNEYLIGQSIRQNEILFTQEGLTVLNVDRIYTLKRRLCVLTTAQAAGNFNHDENKCISSCVHLLHQTITSCQGRPFSFGFFKRAYEHLDVADGLLNKVASEYKSRYEQEGIILNTPKSSPALPALKKELARKETARKDAVRKEAARKLPAIRTSASITRVRRSAMGPPSVRNSHIHYGHGHIPSRAPSRAGTPRRGAKTPVSASDVTPITRNEWNILIGPDFYQNKPTVTMWVPNPPAVAVVG
ncbi:hypothetical protein UA08_03622 [Talaromyces atroroseus]|uniref:DUF7582 domain-containing protein n=1 Tax=Talaromyces atroroseus TaxID=1441469 RepID=A0A225ANA4_TALAT|nr:hypothetical protein UA08_03622 [Talaromyces atroroseus]OKL60933.1 hypothetical protein UA08_03622 [Talaromyces atroroseus]